MDGRQLPSIRHELSLSIANPPGTPEQEEDLDDDDDDSLLYLDEQSNLDTSGASEIISTSSRIHLEGKSIVNIHIYIGLIVSFRNTATSKCCLWRIV
jgi:hypothetical protein